MRRVLLVAVLAAVAYAPVAHATQLCVQVVVAGDDGPVVCVPLP